MSVLQHDMLSDLSSVVLSSVVSCVKLKCVPLSQSQAEVAEAVLHCAEHLAGRMASAVPEARTMKNALPSRCSVKYFRPNHDDNPTKIALVNDAGVDEDMMATGPAH